MLLGSLLRRLAIRSSNQLWYNANKDGVEAAIVIGIVCAAVGFAVKMPNFWFLGDSLSSLVLGVLIVFFWRWIKEIYQSLNNEIKSDYV